VHRVLLLLPSATYRAPDFVRAAEAVGAEVVVASDRRPALAGLMGERALTVDLHRPEAAADAIVRRARHMPLDAVVAADDQGVLVAALAARRLGLAHNPPAAAARSRDKAAMREALDAAGVPQPAFRSLGSSADHAAAVAAIGFPCVVKPVSLSGSRGVIRADTVIELHAAAARTRAILSAAGEDPSSSVLVERFVPGPEVAVEALLRGGDLEVLAIFDKPDPLVGPYFEETIYVTPSRLPAARLRDAERVTAAAAAAIGLVEGPVHAELRLPDAADPMVIEVAARSIGGLCSRSLRFGAGISLEEVILRHALGLPLEDLRRDPTASGVMMIPIPSGGVLREVAGLREARAVPGIVGLEITIPMGREVVPLPEGDRYLGFLFARGDTPEAVEAALRMAHGRLDIRIDQRAAATVGVEVNPDA
jgi:biotin carboxylase